MYNNGADSMTIAVFMYLAVSTVIRKLEVLLLDPLRLEWNAPVRPPTRLG